MSTAAAEKKVTVDDIIEVLTEGHLRSEGGYPYDYRWIGYHLVIAGHRGGSDSQTELTVYTGKQMNEWAVEATEALEDYDGDKEEAILETTPEEEAA